MFQELGLGSTSSLPIPDSSSKEEDMKVVVMLVKIREIT